MIGILLLEERSQRRPFGLIVTIIRIFGIIIDDIFAHPFIGFPGILDSFIQIAQTPELEIVRSIKLIVIGAYIPGINMGYVSRRRIVQQVRECRLPLQRKIYPPQVIEVRYDRHWGCVFQPFEQIQIEVRTLLVIQDFVKKLEKLWDKNKFVCVGLDPVLDKLPPSLRKKYKDLDEQLIKSNFQ